MPPKKWGHLSGQRPLKEHISLPKSATLVVDPSTHEEVFRGRGNPDRALIMVPWTALCRGPAVARGAVVLTSYIDS